MLPKCAVFLLLVFATTNPATSHPKNIPVEVRYERLRLKNLDEKVQLSPLELRQNELRLQKVDVGTGEERGKSNLEEKVQLSSDELLQAYKHVPIGNSGSSENLESGSDQIQDVATVEEKGKSNLEEKVQLSSDELLQAYKHLPIDDSGSLEKSGSEQIKLVERIEAIFDGGLEKLKINFPVQFPQSRAPSKELWDKLEKEVKNLLLEEKNKLGSRQSGGAPAQQNFIQNMINGIQQAANNFVSQVSNQNQSQNGTSGDEGSGSQGPFQGFVGYFQGGFQNIVNSIQNVANQNQGQSGNSTVLGDSATNQQPPSGIIGGFVNGVQQFFQGPQQVILGNNTQGDAGTPSGGQQQQQGFFQGAISQINQVVGNFIPAGTSPAPANVQGDEEGGGSSGAGGTSPTGGSGPIQQVFQSFGNLGTAVNQFFQGGQQNRPPGSEDENTSQTPPNQNFIQNIGQNIGNAFQNFQNQFRPPATNQNASSSGNRPIVEQVSNVGNQFQEIAGQVVAQGGALQNVIPGGPESSSKNPDAKKKDKEMSPGLEITTELSQTEAMTATE